MAKFGMFYGWNRPVPGREADAAELFDLSMKYWGKLQHEGKVESFEPVLMNRHGGDLNGFVLVRADQQKFAAVMETMDYRELMIRLDHVVLGFGAVPVYLGDALGEQMAIWQRLVVKK